MKKLFTIFVIIVSFILLCFLVYGNIIKDRKIETLNNHIIELKNITATGMILFEKQTKCGALTPDIEKKIVSFRKDYQSLGEFSIGGIFYSPIKDACLWIRITTTNALDGSPMERRALYQFGDDSATTDPIIGCERMLYDKQGVNACADWNKELKRLKGESYNQNRSAILKGIIG